MMIKKTFREDWPTLIVILIFLLFRKEVQ